MLIGLKQSDAVTSVGVASGRIGTPVNGRTTLIGCAPAIRTMGTVCSRPSAPSASVYDSAAESDYC